MLMKSGILAALAVAVFAPAAAPQDETHDLKWLAKTLELRLSISRDDNSYSGFNPISFSGCTLVWSTIAKPTLTRARRPSDDTTTHRISVNLAQMVPQTHIARVRGDEPIALVLIRRSPDAILDESSKNVGEAIEISTERPDSIALQFRAKDIEIAREISAVFEREIRRCSGAN